ncbi:GatB/YqeY domain-containing protein [Thermicanus aegyptius]|uniref:GatB/YqeY domain-containing protein n=1 Tax=Thermicanus aegyptius TaxID=94009 RepID=UPI00040F2EBD|nr:GatB/YqeY domain-containing protein [Thermicanus aegyptius]
MPIMERLNQDLKEAMKDKDSFRLSVVRMLKSSLKNEEINRNKPLSEEEELSVLTRELKMRLDSLQEFERAGRKDLIDKAQREIAIVKSYLPEELSEEELRQMIQEVISQVGATSKKDMGKVMANLMPKVTGRADGKRVNQLVQEYLS